MIDVQRSCDVFEVRRFCPRPRQRDQGTEQIEDYSVVSELDLTCGAIGERVPGQAGCITASGTSDLNRERTVCLLLHEGYLLSS